MPLRDWMPWTRKKAAQTRGYAVTKPGYKRPMHRSYGDGNSVVGQAGTSLRSQARYSEENYDLTRSILDVLNARVVGRGLTVEPQVLTLGGELHEDVNDQIERLVKRFARAPEVTGQLSMAQCERLMLRSWLRDGEVFCQHVSGIVPDIPGTERMPYRFEMLEADYVPLEYPESTNPRIIQGVELNRWSRPVAYYVAEEHPESTFASYGIIPTAVIPTTRRVDAANMSHIAFRLRLHQVRGVSILAPALARLVDNADLDESIRIAQKLAARLVGFVKKGQPDSYGMEDTNDSIRYFDHLVAGSLVDDLRPGESVELLDTRRQQHDYLDIRNSNLRSAAGGTMVNYSSVAKSYDGSYSAQRQELVEGAENYEILRNEFVSSWRQEVHTRTVAAGLASGQVRLDPDVDMDTLFDALFYASSVPWIDPKKEADAQVTMVEAGLATRSEFLRQRGRNPREVARQRRAEQALFGDMQTNQAPEESMPEDEEPEARSILRFAK